MSAVWEEKRRAFAARMTTAGFDPDPANAGTVLDTALEENRVRIRALAEAVARDEQALAEREALPSMIEEWTARREAHTLAEKAREERERELLSVQAAAKAGEAACLADIPPSLPTIGALRQEDAAIRADIRRLTDELDAVSRRRDELTLRRERFLTARDEARSAVEILAASAAGRETAYLTALSERHFTDDAAMQAALLPPGEQQARQRRLEEYAAALHAAEADVNRLTAETAGASDTAAEMEALKERPGRRWRPVLRNGGNRAAACPPAWIKTAVFWQSCGKSCGSMRLSRRNTSPCGNLRTWRTAGWRAKNGSPSRPPCRPFISMKSWGRPTAVWPG